MATFVNIPAADLDAFLKGLKFEPATAREEVVYTRPCKADPRVVMVVYTSIKAGEAAVRGAGKDAIRVALTYNTYGGRTRGVRKNTRVNRVGTVEGVLGRLKERLTETALWTQAELRRCPTCGGVAYKSGLCLEGHR